MHAATGGTPHSFRLHAGPQLSWGPAAARAGRQASGAAASTSSSGWHSAGLLAEPAGAQVHSWLASSSSSSSGGGVTFAEQQLHRQQQWQQRQRCLRSIPAAAAAAGAGASDDPWGAAGAPQQPHQKQQAAAAAGAAAGSSDAAMGPPEQVPQMVELRQLGSRSWVSGAGAARRGVAWLLSSLSQFLAAAFELRRSFVAPPLPDALRWLCLVLAASLVMVVVVATIDSAWLWCYLLRARRLAG